MKVITLKLDVLLTSNHLQHSLLTEHGLNELFLAISLFSIIQKPVCVSSKNTAVGFFMLVTALSTECHQFLTTNMALVMLLKSKLFNYLPEYDILLIATYMSI